MKQKLSKLWETSMPNRILFLAKLSKQSRIEELYNIQGFNNTTYCTPSLRELMECTPASYMDVNKRRQFRKQRPLHRKQAKEYSGSQGREVSGFHREQVKFGQHTKVCKKDFFRESKRQIMFHTVEGSFTVHLESLTIVTSIKKNQQNHSNNKN